jgi:hypothetical protein
LTSQDTIIIKDKTTTHTPPNILSLNPLTKKHDCENSDNNYNKLLTLKQQITDNTHLATRQTFLTSQNSQINTIKKNKKENNQKDKKKPKKDKTPIVNTVESPTIDPIAKNSEDKVTNHKPLCYRCKKLSHVIQPCQFM